MKVSGLYKIECYIFRGINRYFDQKTLNLFFSNITHIGGATFYRTHTVLLIFASGTLHQAAIATAISLAISHIPVQILKRWYPRKRPYLTIQDAKYPVHPLQDHSSRLVIQQPFSLSLFHLFAIIQAYLFSYYR